jgi:nicotinamide-nucleotide amidase
MTAATLIIGDEILIGQTADTNSAAIATHLNGCGIRMAQMRTVGDNAADITAALSELLQIVDIVMVTGGLGPTKDDITKDILGKYFGATAMVVDESTLETISNLSLCGNFEMNNLNRAQALVPNVCKVLPNAVGTAPGMWFEADGKIVIALPGVPFEMQHILCSQVLPIFEQRLKNNITHCTALVFGIAESMLAQKIEAWEDALPADWHLAYLPSPLGIKLRLSNYTANDTISTENEAQKLFADLKSIIPQYFIGIGDYTLEHFAAEKLRNGNFSIATAESCTGGRISTLLTSISGSSAYFKGGIVAYNNAVKTNVLGVPPTVIERCGAVSKECVIDMALGIQKLLNTDFAIAVSGIAGPTGGTADKPVGTIYIGIASPRDISAYYFDFGQKNRAHIIERSAANALNLLIKHINKHVVN